jgi:hypothetical protein
MYTDDGRVYLPELGRRAVGEQLVDAYGKRVHNDKRFTLDQRIDCIEQCCVDSSLTTIFDL